MRTLAALWMLALGACAGAPRVAPIIASGEVRESPEIAIERAEEMWTRAERNAATWEAVAFAYFDVVTDDRLAREVRATLVARGLEAYDKILAPVRSASEEDEDFVDVPPKPLRPLDRALLRVARIGAQLGSPSDPRRTALELEAVIVLHERHHDDEAIAYATALLEAAPDSAVAPDVAMLLLDTFNRRLDLDGLDRWVRRLETEPRLDALSRRMPDLRAIAMKTIAMRRRLMN